MCRSANLWPCEDFGVGPETLALLVVSAWTAGEDLCVFRKTNSVSSWLLKSEYIEGRQHFMKYSTHPLRSLLNSKRCLEKHM